MKYVYIVEIPILNYEGDGVFHKQLFFDHSPSFEEVLALCEKQDEKYLKLADLTGYFGEMGDCVNSLKQFDFAVGENPAIRWESVFPTSLVETCQHFPHKDLAQFANQVYIAWRVVEVHT